MSKAGVVTALKPGKAVITATSKANKKDKATITITVKKNKAGSGLSKPTASMVSYKNFGMVLKSVKVTLTGSKVRNSNIRLIEGGVLSASNPDAKIKYSRPR